MGYHKPEVSKMALPSNKFIRRTDLNPSTRLYIAYTALMAKAGSSWGTITSLSRQFLISRMFVYMLAHSLEQTSLIVFGDPANKPLAIEEKTSLQYILSLRLEGKCSIGAISTIMKRFGLKNASVGSISQTLQYIGELLPNTLSTDNNEIQLVVFVSDEIFSKTTPLLVTVDPISSAILRIELADTRKAKDWKNHWQCLEKNGYYSIYLVSDEGKGLSTAHKEALTDIIRQPDTYHAIAHQLGQWVKILEDAAYKAIQNEIERYDKLDSAKSDPVINKRFEHYENARQLAIDALELYDNFYFVYKCLIKELDLFDDRGNLRERMEADENITAGLSLLEEIDHSKIIKAVQKVQRTMPDLLQYFDIAKDVISDIKNMNLNQEALQSLFLAWQWGKKRLRPKNPKPRGTVLQKNKTTLNLRLLFFKKSSMLSKSRCMVN